MNTVKTYYQLTKPGIIYANAMTTVAGFLLASKLHIDIWLLLAIVSGTALVIASGCVCNNYIDRNLDKHMARTKKRALVTGKVTGAQALMYASVLAVLGFAILAVYTNALTVWVGAIGFIDYVILYAVSKRRSTLGTIVGSISGATPILAGYTAVSNNLDAGAILVFLIMVIWQMPHFYAIATYRKDDYEEAGLPVLPVVRGLRVTKIYMLLYVAAYGVAAALLTIYGVTGYVYLAIIILISSWWLKLAIKGFKAPDPNKWARKMFGFSLIVLLVFSALISVDALLP
jgi:protoheme IX farnesyltransferase